MILPAKVKKFILEQLRHRCYSLQRLSELTRLADRFGSDKGTHLSAHMYTRVYEKFFEQVRYKSMCLLEIGLLRFDIDNRRPICAKEGGVPQPAADAPSLRMWSCYFPNAKIFGFDIDDFSGVKIDRCTIFQGDASSRDDLYKLVNQIGQPIDIIIDDASHASHHQQIALGVLFKHLREGGTYVIEDLQWQPSSLERDGVPKTRDLLRNLRTRGSLESPCITADETAYIREHTSQVLLFDSCNNDVIDNIDAIALLIKR